MSTKTFGTSLFSPLAAAGMSLSPPDPSSGDPKSKKGKTRPQRTAAAPTHSARIGRIYEHTPHVIARLFGSSEDILNAHATARRPKQRFILEMKATKASTDSLEDRKSQLDDLLSAADFPITALYNWIKTVFEFAPQTSLRGLNDQVRTKYPDMENSQYVVEKIIEVIHRRAEPINSRLDSLIDILKEDPSGIPLATLLFLTETYWSIDRDRKPQDNTLPEMQIIANLFIAVVQGRSPHELVILANQITRLGLKNQFIYNPLREIFEKYTELSSLSHKSKKDVLHHMAQVTHPPLAPETLGSLAAEVARNPNPISNDDLNYYFQLIANINNPELQVYRLGRIARNPNITPHQLVMIESEIRNLSDASLNSEPFWKQYGYALAKVIGHSHYAFVEGDWQFQLLKLKQAILELMILPWDEIENLEQALNTLLRNVVLIPESQRNGMETIRTRLKHKFQRKLANNEPGKSMTEIIRRLVPTEWLEWQRYVSEHPDWIITEVEIRGRTQSFDELWSKFIKPLA